LLHGHHSNHPHRCAAEKPDCAPKVLFQGSYQTLTASTPNYDVSADGQRFLMLEPTEQTAQINVVLNWFEELKQKVPNGNR